MRRIASAKMKTVLAVLFCIAGVGRVCAGVEFAGYMTADGDVRVVLVDAESHRASDWLEIGQVFSGYTVHGFDQKAEVLTVERQGEKLTLSLKQGSVSDRSAARTALAEELA